MEYSLELADGQAWQIMAAKGAEEWVDEFTAIMGIQKTDSRQGRKLIITAGRNGVELDPQVLSFADIAGGLINTPAEGWRRFKVRGTHCLIHKNIPDIICGIDKDADPVKRYLQMWGTLQLVYAQAQHNGSLPLHAALIEKNGKGVILCAKGDTGKTTCCKRVPLPWRPLCDDETLVVRIGAGHYVAHPFPTWSEYLVGNADKMWDVAESVNICALVFLEQADTDELVPLRQAQAAIMLNLFSIIFMSSYMGNLNIPERKNFRSRLFDNISGLVRAVPAYILRLSLTGKFWEELEKIDDTINT